MKLNPPETAPRDGTAILAWFSFLIVPAPVPHTAITAMWDGRSHHWYFSEECGHKDGDAWFDNGFISDNYLHGWLPMPQIDAEGNVTWPRVEPDRKQGSMT